MSNFKLFFLVYLLPALLIMMIVPWYLLSQDEEVPIQQEPLVPKVDILKEMRRDQLKAVMGSVLLERYLRPFDDWVANRGFVKEQLHGPDDYDKEIWFILLIKEAAQEPIWVKFHLNKVYTATELGFAESDLTVENHAIIIRKGLKSTLEQNIIQHLDDEELRKSIIYGEAHIYRLISRESKIDDIRKEDLVQ